MKAVLSHDRIDVTRDGPGVTCFLKDYRSVGDMVSDCARKLGVTVDDLRAAMEPVAEPAPVEPPKETKEAPAKSAKPKGKKKV